MNYYQDERFGFSNNRNKYDIDNKELYCFKKVEETFCCFPSYYDEEETKDERRENKCWEGTFKICPKLDHTEKKDYDERCKNRNNSQCHRHFNPCCWSRHW